MSVRGKEKPVIYGYAGQILRVDLSKSDVTAETHDEAFLRKFLGGATLGIKYIYDEVPPEIAWSDPENRVFIGSGPLGGTRVGGTGCTAVVTKGALTGGMASSQANGFFGAFLRSSGFDGIVIQGASTDWVYLYIHDGQAELRDASHLVGKETFEVDTILKKELEKKEREASILSIGVAGENLVRFACILTDKGHVASHNGMGAVMGSKKIKAIAVDRGKSAIPLKDDRALSEVARKLRAIVQTDQSNNMTLVEGTVGGVVGTSAIGLLPVKNYTTNILGMDPEKLEKYTSESLRENFNARLNPCWGCQSKHCHTMEITEGKYKGLEIEEPEYEGMAANSGMIGIDDPAMTLVLCNTADRLGIDVNETGWIMGWVMECYEKGILTKQDTDGLEMTWGNGEAVKAMMEKISRRQGFGDILAEGVMRASQRVGGKATGMAIHTRKGNTPHTHDHRTAWNVLFDHCVSNTGASENMPKAPWKQLGVDPNYDTFDPEQVSTIAAKMRGSMQFEDSLVICDYQSNMEFELLCEAVNAATGWDMDFEEAMTIGKRAINMARAYNIRCGMGAELDTPSERYGSVLPDGQYAGRDVKPHWDGMLRNYYRHMGWDEKTSKPLPETLKNLGLDFIIPHLWS
jgi:aldehyde:ferredoxin oxidoreductase